MTQQIPQQRDDRETVAIEATREGGPVDPPVTSTTFADITSRRDVRPILPAALRSRAGWVGLVVDTARLAVHASGFHAVRLPLYAGRAAMYAPRGLWRALYLPVRWASAEEGNWHLRQQAANRNDPQTWLALDERRMRHSSWRWPVVITLAFAVAVSGVTFAYFAPGGRWVIVGALFLLAGWMGRPADKPIVDRVTLGGTYVRLTADLTRAALVACGAGIKDPAAVTFPREIARDPAGRGHVAVISLPAGVVATDVIDRRDRLAAGFRLPVDQVWPDPVRGEHPGMLEIYVSDKPVSAMRQPPWPLLEEGTTDYFEPFPYGADVRLRPVTWSLAERNSLFGGVPGSGKSLAARNVLLGAVLDPLVIPVISELKGSGDYDCFEQLCPPGMYVCGADERSIARTLDIIEWLYGLCEERGPLVAKYARAGMNSVKKVNRAMAEHDERLRPVVAMFDEVQEFMSSKHGIKGPGAPMLLSTIKRARALGIHVIVATQRFDKDSLPKAISSLITNRAALAVPAQPETDMILGTSAYRTGARPTAFVPGEDSGWMVRAGFTAGYETVRAALVDDDQAAAVCARALALRSGVRPEPGPVRVHARNLLDDVRRVWDGSEPALWSELIVPRLRHLDPEVYGDLTVEIFGARMAAAGVPTADIGRRIDGKATTRKGVRLAALDARIKAAELESR
ncbi:FtsK/SpoIIIE domain-containing protein [Micromonospora inyonensis]|uniref:DNA segregation ATPase FtsK/SpoIIIE, S-DNA-T family n=1 Tax=Micromonospora inyonensis TaxID=47866 RepID=A0A1C6RTK5_9ACTN|nr:FtsK/SpoIIIE domain-containing protein [Micromonospora inyonensis]SCL20462.1 DNA segregation ATPase FtsK/SpoIIIE, S-DNA-T family [Micromonospora inyonensis]SCL25464.1 DNA segregation ATPase FtsK/SpoIIIE, S-DNA-T family [Micromonospora inyonensis]